MSRLHALVIGIDAYPGFGPESQLAGAVRDARAMAEVLIDRHGFARRDVLFRLGEVATREVLLDALEALRRRVAPGDQVVVFFSGHGSQMTDREGDEGDGLDETLVPYDSGREGAENRDITDDEINLWAAGVLAVTPHLTLIFDCCHAGTLHRPGWRVRSVPPDLRPAGELPPSPVRGSPVGTWRDVEVGPRPLVLAACRDDELAYELPPSAGALDRGAFSSHLTAALHDALPRETWREVFARAASVLAVDCPEQHPQLSGDGIDVPLFGGDRSLIRGVESGESLLDLAHRPNPFGLAIDVFRSRGGAWRQLAEREAPFAEGDRLRVDLRHAHDRELFFYLLDVGLTGAVTLLFPDAGGHEALDPGLTLTVGDRRGDALELFLPDDLPSGESAGVGRLVLVASEARLQAAQLLAGSVDEPMDAGEAVAAIVRPYRLRQA